MWNEIGVIQQNILRVTEWSWNQIYRWYTSFEARQRYRTNGHDICLERQEWDQWRIHSLFTASGCQTCTTHGIEATFDDSWSTLPAGFILFFNLFYGFIFFYFCHFLPFFGDSWLCSPCLAANWKGLIHMYKFTDFI